MKANNQPQDERFHNKQIYIKFYRNEVLKHYKLSFNKFLKLSQERRLFLSLKVLPATAKVVAKAFKMPTESVCRRKRSLENAGHLQTSRKQSICPFTKNYAKTLTTDETLFNSKYFGYE